MEKEREESDLERFWWRDESNTRSGGGRLGRREPMETAGPASSRAK